MSSNQVIYQYLSAGSHTLTVPAGFSNQVLVYAWGAGGADSQAGVAGGGGGFAQGIVTVSSGDTVIISVGSTGSPDGIGGSGTNPVISLSGGSSGPVTSNDWDGKSGPGAGGGAASAVLVNSIPMLVAAGGGGAGGGFDYQSGSVGTAGGVTTLASTTPQGGVSPDGYAVGGGGGGGYPLGGAGGTSAGDDAGGGAGGYGGQNYANASVTSSTLTAGSGVVPGGLTNALYPKAKRGYAGYDGAVIVIFTKSFQAYIKDTDWKLITNAYVKIPSSSTTLYTTVPPTTLTFNTGTNLFTVPPGVYSLNVSLTAGGGGGGGIDGGNPSQGRGGKVITFTQAVTPGTTYRIGVGGGGRGGTNLAIPAAGGAGGISATYSGIPNFTGGTGGTGYSSGGGGGGGAASWFAMSEASLIAVAGGGAGGGGSGRFGGPPGYATGFNSTSSGANGQTYSGDSPGGGGGGAGYLYGGAGGTLVGGDTGAYGGNDGQSLVPGGGTTSTATNFGGTGVAGGSGVVTISYSSAAIASIGTTGGWKPITRAWIKADDEWKPIQSGVSLIPIRVESAPTSPVTINLTIAANTNNYVLSDFLSATSYYPGHSIVNLYVNAGVIVGSGTVGTPALIVDGLVSGDLINLTNNGNIAGAGGQGGAAGSYSSSTSGGSKAPSKGSPMAKGSYSSGTTTVTSVPGRPGELGGPALYVTYQTNLVNNGTIAGGGGGGGGGGGPTGGQGGGGAGRRAGSGANNGTLTAGGAGAGIGGAGGARGSAGSAGTNDTNSGGVGGAPGAAILGIDKVIIITAGTILGERRV